MFNSIKDEIKTLKNILYLVIGISILFWWAAFAFNQYLTHIYKEKIKIEKEKWRRLQNEINSFQKKIDDLLQWRNLTKIKKMEEIYNIYFQSRFKILPKELILELLEEILPQNAKISNNIKIWKDTSLSLTLRTTDIQGLDTLYNKFQYYSSILKLFTITWFDTIELKEWNKKIVWILWNVPYAYKTTIKLKLNYDNIRKYYSLIYKPDTSYKEFSDIFWPDLIEPNNIPDNINISDILELHKLYEKKYVSNNKSK